MTPSYDVIYAIPFRTREEVTHRETDDLTSCQSFLVELLEGGFQVRRITRAGVPLSTVEVQGLLRRAAELLVQKHRAMRRKPRF